MSVFSVHIRPFIASILEDDSVGLTAAFPTLKKTAKTISQADNKYLIIPLGVVKNDLNSTGGDDNTFQIRVIMYFLSNVNDPLTASTGILAATEACEAFESRLSKNSNGVVYKFNISGYSFLIDEEEGNGLVVSAVVDIEASYRLDRVSFP